jgi:hypothetical protein
MITMVAQLATYRHMNGDVGGEALAADLDLALVGEASLDDACVA